MYVKGIYTKEKSDWVYDKSTRYKQKSAKSVQRKSAKTIGAIGQLDSESGKEYICTSGII